MKLTETQNDTLKEIINIGVSKAATQLSVLLNDEILMQVPEISILTIAEACRAVFDNIEQSIVFQDLAGMLAGRTYLIFQGEDSRFLAQAVLGNAFSQAVENIQFYEQEALMEIGNIVISACMSTIANLLEDKIMLSTPIYTENSMSTILLEQVDNALFVLIIRTLLRASKRDITGTLVIVVTSELAGSLFDKLSRFCNFTE